MTAMRGRRSKGKALRSQSNNDNYYLNRSRSGGGSNSGGVGKKKKPPMPVFINEGGADATKLAPTTQTSGQAT